MLESAIAAFASELTDPTLLRSTLEVDPVTGQASATRAFDVLYDRIAARISSSDAREDIKQAVIDAIENSDQTIDDIINNLHATSATLADAHAQIAQMFANLDVAAMIDRLGIDLGTLANAILSHERIASSERDAIFAEFLGREYLDALGISLP